jgi:hypothetical protein
MGFVGMAPGGTGTAGGMELTAGGAEDEELDGGTSECPPVPPELGCLLADGATV